MVVMNFLKLFFIAFILLYRVGLCPWPLPFQYADKPFGYLTFSKNVHNLSTYTALSLLFK